MLQDNFAIVPNGCKIDSRIPPLQLTPVGDKLVLLVLSWPKTVLMEGLFQEVSKCFLIQPA
jgi:hypothetical protein